MKKKLMAMVFAVVMLFAFSTVSTADTISTGDVIYLKDSVGGDNGLGGGLFTVYNVTNPSADTFVTFCIELLEKISFYTEYTVSISDSAVYGSYGSNPDPLDDTTAYLYYAFRVGTLTTAFDYASASDIDALQLAIWYFEEGYTAALSNTEAAALIAEALAAVNSGWSNDGKIAVINPYVVNDDGSITQKQSLLVLVPEPAALILLGLGLVGLGAVRRIKK